MITANQFHDYLIKKYYFYDKNDYWISDTKIDLKINHLMHLFHVKYGYSQRPKVSKAKRKRVYERDKGICAYCGKHVPFHGFHIDHVIPLAKGGNNEDSNLVVSCPSCNLHKGTKIIEPIKKVKDHGQS